MAYDFPTNTNYEAASAVVTAYPLTMACWFYVANTTTNRTLMDLGNTTENSGQALNANSSGQVVAASTIAGGTSTAVTTTTYSANTWHHAAAVFASATDRRSFLDGGGKGTNVTSRLFAASIDRTLLGRRLRTNAYTQPITGRLAECAIWNVALSDDEIYSLSRGYTAHLVRPSSLVFYAPIVREVQDLARGVGLTAVGTPTVIEHPRRIG